MFIQFIENGLSQVEPTKIDPQTLTVGYVKVEELTSLNHLFAFDESTIAACKNANVLFRSGVEVHKDYTFTELRILNAHEVIDDYIALYVKKNLILVVDISDEDGSTKEKFLSCIQRYPADKVNCEKVLAAFLDSLLIDDMKVLEDMEDELSEQEELLLEKDVDQDFNVRLLQTKKQLSKRHAYYAQLLDITDTVCENDNGIFLEDNLIYVDNVSKRISRLREDTASLKGTVEHLQDAYSSYLDVKMNNTMKALTVLSTIFFPLTIIVGWYGMNFQYMPEFAWKGGYIYVIALSVVTVAVFALIGKWKKWF